MNNQPVTEHRSKQLSKHEQYLVDLAANGLTLPQIASAWHTYYAHLPDTDQQAVWKEYHDTNQFSGIVGPQPVVPPPLPDHIAVPLAEDLNAHPLQRRLRSLAVGLVAAAVVSVIFLFGLFNEVVITPFVQPSQTASAVPLIVNSASTTSEPMTKVIVPKINIEIPVDYSLTTTEEKAFQKALDTGVVHYPSTVRPGEVGNAAFFGHSSNNIFNSGKYKFAFVLLHKIIPKDMFYLTYDGKLYAYEVIYTKVVAPSEVGVLGPVPGEKSTATLITCDPPGTSNNRLVVVGRQLSPDPGVNAAPSEITPQSAASETVSDLPGNGPSIWSRFWDSVF